MRRRRANERQRRRDDRRSTRPSRTRSCDAAVSAGRVSVQGQGRAPRSAIIGYRLLSADRIGRLADCRCSIRFSAPGRRGSFWTSDRTGGYQRVVVSCSWGIQNGVWQGCFRCWSRLWATQVRFFENAWRMRCAEQSVLSASVSRLLDWQPGWTLNRRPRHSRALGPFNKSRSQNLRRIHPITRLGWFFLSGITTRINTWTIRVARLSARAAQRKRPPTSSVPSGVAWHRTAEHSRFLETPFGSWRLWRKIQTWWRRALGAKARSLWTVTPWCWLRRAITTGQRQILRRFDSRERSSSTSTYRWVRCGLCARQRTNIPGGDAFRPNAALRSVSLQSRFRCCGLPLNLAKPIFRVARSSSVLNARTQIARQAGSRREALSDWVRRGVAERVTGIAALRASGAALDSSSRFP